MTQQRSVRFDWPGLADILAVVVFAAIGTRSHDAAGTIGQVIHVAVPFVLGAAVGRFVADARKVDSRSYAAGLHVLAGAVVLGMIIRKLVYNEGTALPFIIVATLTLALFFLGWRMVAARYEQVRSRTAVAPASSDASPEADTQPDVIQADGDADREPVEGQSENRPGESSSGNAS